ncbi:hypothetical protein ACFC25_16685 [Pseudarthrobacter sp. NPDC055928]|uniref:hypothetical protein n=1 Tax=Pseudarthrobacter sp. NPDC055928 TaxID=3345661 RepID=UPI0035DF176A
MRPQLTEHSEVIVTAPELLHELLTKAEAALRLTAMARGNAGILVTRHDARHYTLALDDAVPFGETYERSLFEPPKRKRHGP